MEHLKCLLTVFVILLANQLAHACTCFGDDLSIEEEYKKSDVVFVGSVIEKERIIYQAKDSLELELPEIEINRYKILVAKTFKGSSSSKYIYVYSGTGKGDCGFKFEIGEKYILYGTTDDPILFSTSDTLSSEIKAYTDICTRTKEFDENECKKLKKVAQENKN